MPIISSQQRKPVRNTFSRKRHAKSGTRKIRLGRAFSIVKYAFYALLVCVFVASFAWGGTYLHAFMTESSYFAIKDIAVSGNSMLSREQVLEMAAIPLGTNSLTVDLEAVENNVMQSPWCTAVSVKRLLPDRFEIKIQERVPAFWILQNGKLHYADIQGDIVAPVEAQSFTALPRLEFGHGGEALLPRMAEIITIFKEARLPMDISLVSWIKLSAGKGVELYLDRPGLHISVDAEDLRANLNRLYLVLADLGRRGDLPRAAELRSADGNVWVLAQSRG